MSSRTIGSAEWKNGAIEAGIEPWVADRADQKIGCTCCGASVSRALYIDRDEDCVTFCVACLKEALEWVLR